MRQVHAVLASAVHWCVSSDKASMTSDVTVMTTEVTVRGLTLVDGGMLFLPQHVMLL